jgi:glycosyltransferase involved in cell wall biosynthesis
VNVLFLIKGLGRGGAEQLLVSTVRHADRRRFSFRVAYLLPWKDALVGELRDEGADVRCLDGARGVGWTGRLRRLARGADLVHVHSPYPAVGARMTLPRRLPFVYTEHNGWARYHRATYWANALTYGRNDHVFAVSDQVRDSIRLPRGIRWRHMPPVETLHHGPDPALLERAAASSDARAELTDDPEVLVVGTVANLKAHKGIDVLLEAVPLVLRDVPRARFVVVGQGPLEADLRARAAAMGLNGAVRFTGFREDAARLAGAFDVFVLPSLHEGLPIALLEAMSLGRPPVVTPVGGVPEVVHHGRDALVVPPSQPAALAEALVGILRDPAMRARLGANAARRAADFDIRTAVRRMEDVWMELAG